MTSMDEPDNPPRWVLVVGDVAHAFHLRRSAGVSPAADVTRHYRLGTVFAAGDPDALEHAVRTTPRRLDPVDVARAREGLSARAVAAAVLEALSEPCSTPGGPDP